MRTDIIIVGSGCAGMYCALNLPKNKDILIITKDIVEHSDSFLAQGGMCMLKDKEDFDSYFYDTMKAGHFENDTAAVETMINSSPDLVKDLLSYGVDFARDEDGNLAYTREGAHARNRILYHEDITGKEITSHIYEQCKKRDNITIKEDAERPYAIAQFGEILSNAIIQKKLISITSASYYLRRLYCTCQWWYWWNL